MIPGISLSLLIASVFGLIVPALFIRLLVPALEQGRTTTNFRGTEVFLGLGVVWLVWSGCAILAGVAGSLFVDSGVLQVFTLAGPLALVAFALGMVDDALGTSGDRGFRGHFRALGSGRMTTGMLKLIGMGAAALVVALVVSEFAPWALGGAGPTAADRARPVAGALVAAAAIALSSNFINLTDLRPGRALKAYSVLAIAGSLALAFSPLARVGGWDGSVVERVGAAVTISIMLLGPVAAVWRYDLSERGMLGDAGANPMGAVVGFMIVLGLPLWGLIMYAVLMLALNLASERFSFSRVIDGNPMLSWFDSLGRLPVPVAERDSSKSSPD